MRKLLTFLTTLTAAVAVIVLFTACEQFLDDPEDFLSYWASEAFIKDHSIGSADRPDGAGVPCVDSSKDVTIMLTVHNPKGVSFVLPTVSESAGIVEFKELSPQPTLGTHYDLDRTSSSRLELTYKKAFLQKYEQGSGSLNPTITLKATDGRVFKKTYTFGIKSNTPPPKPKEIVLAKTKIDTLNPASYYVLCLKFDLAKMTKTVAMNSGFVPVHKDIAKITINDSHYTLLYKEDNSDFQKPYGDSFVERGNVEKLNPSSPDVPSGAWVLYYKTNIKIGDGNPETPYTITLRDKEGVTSDETVARIEASGQTHTVTFSVEGGEGGTLTAQVDGMNIASGSAVERGKTVTFIATPAEGWAVDSWKVNGTTVSGYTDTRYTISSITEPKTVTVKFKKVWTVRFRVVANQGGRLQGTYGNLTKIANFNNDGSEQEFTNVSNGSTVTFNAVPHGSVPSAWKIEDWTASAGTLSGGGTGTTATLTVTDNATVTVEFKKVTAVAGTDNLAWTLLKNAVKVADPNSTITIDGRIEASSGNCGEIEIDETLTIEGKTGPDKDILDANKMSRIFKVASGKTLTLKNLKLTGGKADGTEDADKCGGAIYAKNANEIKIINCTIMGNEAYTNGGGLNVEGTPTTITNCTFTGNTAKNGGGIYIIQGSKIPAVTIKGSTIGGTGTNEANKATGTGSDGNGGGIYVGNLCKVILQNNDSTGCTIKGNIAYTNGGGVYANNADVIMSGRTRIAVDNDVYLDGMSPSNARITVTAPLTAEAPVARITPKTYSLFPLVKVLDGNITGGTPQNYTKFAVTPKGDEYWTVDSNGYLSR